MTRYLLKTRRKLRNINERRLHPCKTWANTCRNFERRKTKDGNFCIEGQFSLFLSLSISLSLSLSLSFFLPLSAQKSSSALEFSQVTNIDPKELVPCLLTIWQSREHLKKINFIHVYFTSYALKKSNELKERLSEKFHLWLSPGEFFLFTKNENRKTTVFWSNNWN